MALFDGSPIHRVVDIGVAAYSGAFFPGIEIVDDLIAAGVLPGDAFGGSAGVKSELIALWGGVGHVKGAVGMPKYYLRLARSDLDEEGRG